MKGETVNSWPNINRARLIRRMLVLGVVTLAFAILYVVLALAGVGGSGVASAGYRSCSSAAWAFWNC